MRRTVIGAYTIIKTPHGMNRDMTCHLECLAVIIDVFCAALQDMSCIIAGLALYIALVLRIAHVTKQRVNKCFLSP